MTEHSREWALEKIKAHKKRVKELYEVRVAKVAMILLENMDHGRVYHLDDLKSVLFGTGYRYGSYTPLAASYLVRHGYADRIAKATYKKLRDLDAKPH
jgi:hypothetical protein